MDLASPILGTDPRHAGYTHIVLHATPLPVQIHQSTVAAAGDSIAFVTAMFSLIAIVVSWRAASFAKSALAETRRATDATLVAANVTLSEAEFLRSERARAPVLTAHFKYETITIDQNGVSVAQIIDANVTYRLIRFQLSVENSGTRESQVATARFRLPNSFKNWIEVPGVSNSSFMGELVPGSENGVRTLALSHPYMVAIRNEPSFGSGRCWVPVDVDHVIEWETLSERDRFPLDGSWGQINVRVSSALDA